jgi:hypothetical protein
MKCGKTNLCRVEEINGKYQVTWNTHITGLDVYSEKLYTLVQMIANDAKSYEVGIMLSSGYVLWLSYTLLATSNSQDLIECIRRSGNVKDHREILGAVFDNMEDVETFADRLEKKYIVHVLKQ